MEPSAAFVSRVGTLNFPGIHPTWATPASAAASTTRSCPFAFHAPAPDHWDATHEHDEASELTDELCIIGGELSTTLPLYVPPTLNLKTHVHTRPVGVRPLIELEPTDHPLAVEQREGITTQRVEEIAAQLLHQ